jgi:glycerophosphoryl diester phosphodiesterase
MNKLTCFAHRGASGHEPENTLPAVQKALELGAEWIEIDVFPVENELVIIHDNDLERTTNGKGTVLQSSLKYLRSLDAGKGQQIPYLYEVFDIIGSRAKLNIELKWIDSVEKVVSTIENYVKNHGWMYERILISSLFHDEVKKAKSVLPDILTAPVFLGPTPDNFIQIALDLSSYSISMDVDYINSEIVDRAHKKGLKVFVFTINTMEDVERMHHIGVDGIFTNYPELLSDNG